MLNDDKEQNKFKLLLNTLREKLQEWSKKDNNKLDDLSSMLNSQVEGFLQIQNDQQKQEQEKQSNLLNWLKTLLDYCREHQAKINQIKILEKSFYTNVINILGSLDSSSDSLPDLTSLKKQLTEHIRLANLFAQPINSLLIDTTSQSILIDKNNIKTFINNFLQEFTNDTIQEPSKNESELTLYSDNNSIYLILLYGLLIKSEEWHSKFSDLLQTAINFCIAKQKNTTWQTYAADLNPRIIAYLIAKQTVNNEYQVDVEKVRSFIQLIENSKIYACSINASILNFNPIYKDILFKFLTDKRICEYLFSDHHQEQRLIQKAEDLTNLLCCIPNLKRLDALEKWQKQDNPLVLVGEGGLIKSVENLMNLLSRIPESKRLDALEKWQNQDNPLVLVGEGGLIQKQEDLCSIDDRIPKIKVLEEAILAKLDELENSQARSIRNV